MGYASTLQLIFTMPSTLAAWQSAGGAVMAIGGLASPPALLTVNALKISVAVLPSIYQYFRRARTRTERSENHPCKNSRLSLK
jgi:hypothetical protein